MNNIFLYPCAFGVRGVVSGKTVSCIIKNSGRINVFAKKSAKFNKVYSTFLINGAVFLFLGLYNLVCGLFEFNNTYSKQNTQILNGASRGLNVSTKSVVYFIVVVLSGFIAYLVLGIVPIKLSFYLSTKNFDLFLKRIVIGTIKCLIIYLFFLALKLFAPFRQYYKFNSAIKNIEEKENRINFLTYFICSVFLNVIVLSIFGLSLNLWYAIFINALVSLSVFMVNYQLFKEIQKNKYTKWIIIPFYFLIKEKPSQNEEKCVNIVLKELEQGSVNKQMENLDEKEQISFSEAYVLAKEVLEKANRFEPSDLDFIFCEILGKNRAEIKLVKSISKTNYKKVLKAVKRRAGGEPITKIFGHANFYGLDFKVTKDVLSPRMDTEVLVEQVLKECNKNTKVLDIGTGSGAIAITLAKLSSAKLTAVDISEKALQVARQNAKENEVKVTFKKSDLFSGLSRFAKFDIIVSNPPYIPTEEIEKLDDEVKKHDPILALDGGKSGLDFYEQIIEKAPTYLKPNGKIFFEIGFNQAKDLKKLLQKNFKDIRIVKDFGKNDRVVIATLNC